MKIGLQQLLFVLALFAGIHQATAQTVVFTYQGFVTDSGTNFTGTGQFKFAVVTSTNANHKATASANISGGFVTTYSVTGGGNGYTAAPSVTVTGGGGSGAAAHANISGGAVTGVVADSPGSGYTSTPIVLIQPPPPNISYTTYWSNDGTSVAGSEPSAALSVRVSNGLFTVVLGDTTQPNMAAITSSLFAQPDLQLQIWFNDGVSGTAALSPAQNLTPTPYAVMAGTANGLPGLSVRQNSDGAPDMIGGSPNNFVPNSVVGATIGGGGAVNYSGSKYTNGVAADFGTVSGGAQNLAGGFSSTVGGGDQNSANNNFSTISGGYDNITSGNYSTVGGGYNNTCSNESATVAGGNANTANSDDATVAGGYGNLASGPDATVGGGVINTASVFAATVCGGNGNTASGNESTVCGGVDNNASGVVSFAAGYKANATKEFSFVWSDGSATTTSATTNSVTMRASGGFRLLTTSGSVGVKLASGDTAWSTISDRNEKKNFQPIDGDAVLEKLAAIPMEKWNYKWESDTSTPHLGPMAQDFKAAFYPGRDDKSISTLEFDGVELAAIQGLNQKVEEQKSELKQKGAEIQELKQRLQLLEQLINRNKWDK